MLNAAPDPLSVFTSWSGTGITCPGTGTCAVTMDKAKTVKATFEKPKTTAGPDMIEVYGEEGEEEAEPRGVGGTEEEED